jgi:acetyl esterase/lipase
MLGTSGDDGNAKAGDPVERESSRVQAVACFFPPTDFLNYGKEGEVALGSGVLAGFPAPFDFNEFNAKTKRIERITDDKRRREIGQQISPITHVTADDAPTLIIHGDADTLVPIQQAQRFLDKCKEVGVTGQLITKPKAGHGWASILGDIRSFADWFDKHLAKK